MAAELRHLIGTLNLPEMAVAFIPSSKQRTDPEFDNRFDYVGAYLREHGIVTTEPIVTGTSHQAVHSDEDSYVDRAPEVIRGNLSWQGFPSQPPANLLLVDDVMTTGGHFRACFELVAEMAPQTNVIGAFWAVQVS